MRQLLISILVSSAVCFGPTLIAAAQDSPRYNREISPRYSYEYGASDFRSSQTLFATVRSDLDRAENNLPEYAAGRYQFDRVRGELSELQRQWDESAYDPSQVDHVIRTLEKVLNTNDLLPRERDALSYDLSRMRDFRNSHE